MSYSKRSGSGQTKSTVCVLSESAPCPLQGQLCEVRVSQGSRGRRGEPALDYATRWGGCQEPEPSGPSSPGCPAPAPALGGDPSWSPARARLPALQPWGQAAFKSCPNGCCQALNRTAYPHPPTPGNPVKHLRQTRPWHVGPPASPPLRHLPVPQTHLAPLTAAFFCRGTFARHTWC